MTRLLTPTLAGLALALGACATTPTAEVVRFHQAAPIAPGTISIEPRDAAFAGLEFDSYAAAVGAALDRTGFRTAPRGRTDYVAVVDIVRGGRAGPTAPPPVSIGIGGASFGRRSGIGGGISFPIGKARTSELVSTQLSVQIRRVADTRPVWEGRARTERRGGTPENAQGVIAPQLADALFQGFPASPDAP